MGSSRYLTLFPSLLKSSHAKGQKTYSSENRYSQTATIPAVMTKGSQLLNVLNDSGI